MPRKRIASSNAETSAGTPCRQIVAALAGKGAPALRGVGAFYRSLAEGDAAALVAWEGVARLLGTTPPKADSPHIARLAAGLGLEPQGVAPSRLLCALHTYYAAAVRALAAHALQGRAAVKKLLPADDLYGWPLGSPTAEVRQALDGIARQIATFPTASIASADRGDLLANLYQTLFPRAIRHALGEYYTPPWLADHVLDQAGYDGDPRVRLLDPTCGSGIFLVQAIRRARAWHAIHGREAGLDDAALCGLLAANCVGCDLNPLAVLSARVNCLLALGDLAGHLGDAPLPVFLGDSILGGGDWTAVPFDMVVGNPPWIAWDNLPADYREATKPLWRRYGLFSLSAAAARHGGGKKDLSMLVVYVAADRYLRHGGRLAMVLTQTLLQTKGAGDGFRKFRLGDEGEWLNVLRVDDLVARKPFDDAANWTCTLALEKGEPTAYPVAYVKWPKAGTAAEDAAQRVYQAEPIEQTRVNSPWFLRPAGLVAKLDALVGPSDYTARLGANSGGANSVYWVRPIERRGEFITMENLAEAGRGKIERVACEVEAAALYPLVRWGDVAPFRAVPSAAILMSQDAASRAGIPLEVMQARYPRALEYLTRFKPLLSQRAAYRRYQAEGPFWSMYNVGPYTFAPTKVVWRRMDRRIRAAVVEPIDDPLLGVRPVVPQETCVFIDVESSDEAHYLCALLNSSVVNFLATAHSVSGGKGFGAPSILDSLRIRRFNKRCAEHGELADLSRLSHQHSAQGAMAAETTRQINRVAAACWGLSGGELAVIDRELAES